MMNNERKTKLLSLGITIAFHLIVVLLLLFFGFPHISPQEESGVLVMVGYTDAASGANPAQGTSQVQPPKVVPPKSVSPPTPLVSPSKNPPLLTQNSDDAPSIAQEQKKKEEEQKKREEELVRKKAEEQRIAAEQEAARQRALEEERKRQEEAIKNLAASAFGSTGAAGDAASSGQASSANGVQGSPTGNSTTGATSGSVGWGSYDLGGRGLRGSLPRPIFDVNSSGVVVVSIAVNAEGNVVSAEISPKGTTTSDRTLRQAAITAARKARFEAKSGSNVQYGTITYRFDSDN